MEENEREKLRRTTTIIDQIEQWKNAYINGDRRRKSRMRTEHAATSFKTEMIGDFLKTQPDVPNPFKDD